MIMLQDIYQPHKEHSDNARIKNMEEYHALMGEANSDYEGFWAKYANEKIDWFKPFDKVLDESNAPFYRWFDGGKFNVAHQCIDRHLATRKNKVSHYI